MFEIFDMLFRFAILPTLLLFFIVVLIGLAHDFIVGVNWTTNVDDILGYEDDGQGDIDDDEETVRM